MTAGIVDIDIVKATLAVSIIVSTLAVVVTVVATIAAIILVRVVVAAGTAVVATIDAHNRPAQGDRQ